MRGKQPASDPEEDEAVILKDRHVEVLHFVIGKRAIRQLHVDVPRRVGHHHRELAEHFHVERTHVALHPLLTQHLNRISQYPH